MGHVFLLGDSIFDNGAYVGGQPSVVDHLRKALPSEWQATLLAEDGSRAFEMREQVRGVDASATHLVVSAGGNDAYDASGILNTAVATVAEAVGLLAKAQRRFREDYDRLLEALVAAGKPVTVCTIYDAIPGLGQTERAALALFNDVILRSAVKARVPVIDLRLVCDQAEDYSEVSPIEPSGRGGAKIAKVIAEHIVQHDSSRRGCTIYW